MKNFWIVTRNSAKVSLFYGGVGSLLFSILDLLGRIIKYGSESSATPIFLLVTMIVFFYSFIAVLFPAILSWNLLYHYAQKDKLKNWQTSEKQSMIRGMLIGMLAASFIIIAILIWDLSIFDYQQAKLENLTIYINPIIRTIEILLIACFVGAFASKKIRSNTIKETIS